jgi:preflagellin peptidase FlaK
MNIPLAISAVVISGVLCYASVLDIKARRVPFRTWYPVIIIGVPLAALHYVGLLVDAQFLVLSLFLGLSVLFCVVFYTFAYLGLFGGADAWALIFISLFVPAFPIRPILGYPPIPFLPFSVLLNAVILNLAVPAGILCWNLRAGRRAPLAYMCFGFPVPGDRIQEYFGFLMEEITEVDGNIRRKFVPMKELFSRSVHGNRTLYTRLLADNPGNYQTERELFRRAGEVWILYGIPFIIPITAGFIVSLLGGDILFSLMKGISGV